MKYIKKYNLFLEDVDASVVPTPVKTQTTTKKLKHGGPEATLEDVFNRLVRVVDKKDLDLEKLINQ